MSPAEAGHYEDLSHSPLWNPDLAPTPPERRTWTTWNIAALWIGMSVVITTYTLASGLMQQGMTWWQAMLTILLGNLVVLVPMILNAHAGTKYGVSFPVLCRAAFGVKGANVPAILRALVACGWFGIQTWIGALALNTLLTALAPSWGTLGAGVWISFAIFWGVQVWLILRGMEGIRHLESWAAPLLLGGGLLLLGWAIVRGGGLGNVLNESVRLQQAQTPFWTLFPAALTANVGYWATLSLNIPDFTRYAKSQRSQALGQALGLPPTMTAFAFIGVAVTSATIVIFGEAVWDPVVLIARIGSPLVVAFGALVVLVAQLTTNMAANVVSPANDFSSLSPKRISYVTGGLITAIIGIAMMPWRLYADAAAYIFTWLVGYSSLMGAIGGVLIADYWVLRRQQLSTADLFKIDGLYSYSNGVNYRAVAALVIAIIPVVPGFIRAATTPGGVIAEPTFLDQLYTYAWFVTFGLSFVLYLLFAPRPATMTTAGRVVAPLVIAAVIVSASCGSSSTPSAPSLPQPPSLRADVADPVGDPVPDPAVAIAPDIVAASVVVSDGTVTATVTFAPGTLSPQTVWAVLLDTDENVTTGFSFGSGVGWDYVLFGFQGLGRIERPGAPGQSVFVGAAPVTQTGDRVVVTAPLSMLGGDDGRMALRVSSTQAVSTGEPGRTRDDAPETFQPAALVR